MDPVDSMKLHLAYGDTKRYLKDNSTNEPRDLFSFMEKSQRQAFLRNAVAALKCKPNSPEQPQVDNGMQADDEYGVGMVAALEALKGR